MGGKSAKAPDYKGAAEATAASDREALRDQTYANRPEQDTPFGSESWESYQDVDPASGEAVTRWRQTTTLNDDAQRALDAELGLKGDRMELGQGMMDRAEAEFGEEMDWSALPEVGRGSEARDRAETAIYDRTASRLDPQWQQREEQTAAKLVAQGLRPGDPAYDQAMDNMSRQKTDAYQQANYGAIMGGGQEADRQYNLESSDRNRQLAEEMQKRGFSLNEINAIISGQQTALPSMPGFNQAGRGMATDYTGAARDQYTADQNAANADNAMWQSMMQGGAGMAMMSDRRLKRNVTLIGSFKQYPLYLFQYIWGKWAVGVMADEVNQDAVTRLPNGYDMVDLARVK
jgi:hypothetical protein